MKMIASIKWWFKETKKIAKALVELRKCGATKKEMDVARQEQLGLAYMRYAKVLEEE